MKPLEVEILVAEVGTEPAGDQLFHILYDGTVVDEDRFSVLGGEADAITSRMKETYQAGASLDEALRIAAAGPRGPDRRWRSPPSRRPCWIAPTGGGPSRIEDDETSELLAAALGSGRSGSPMRRRICLCPKSRMDPRGQPRRGCPVVCGDGRSVQYPGHETAEHHDDDADQRHHLGEGEADHEGPAVGRSALVRDIEGRFDLVGEEELLGAQDVVLVHPHRHVADGVGAVDAAPKLGDDAVGPQPGRDHPRVERVVHRPQVHHAGPGHHQQR